jgi:thymidylate kinase
MYDKIFISGAHGVGKTTLLNAILSKILLEEHHVIPSVSREVHKLGFPINERTNWDTQLLIASSYYSQFMMHKKVLCDRSLIDVLAYSFLIIEMDAKKLDVIETFALTMQKTNCIYFYVPIEFSLQEDKTGIRSRDPNYRAKIDLCILDCFESYKIPFVEVKGTIEERIKIVQKTLKENELQ